MLGPLIMAVGQSVTMSLARLTVGVDTWADASVSR